MELRELEKKRASVASLREVVAAMRNLAAIYVRRAEAGLDAARPYSEVAETAMASVLDRLPPPADGAAGAGPGMVVVFSSEQGLCGSYNEQVVREALTFREEQGCPVMLAAVGRRGAERLRLRGIEPDFTAAAPTSIEGINAQVAELAGDIFERFAASGAGTMTFIYNAYESMGRFAPHRRTVLPPRRERLEASRADAFHYAPLLTASPLAVLGDLVEEYFFIELYRALFESHASENGARLMAMTAAGGNIDERAAALTRDYRLARQDSITAELLDVVGGAEALRSGRGA